LPPFGLFIIIRSGYVFIPFRTIFSPLIWIPLSDANILNDLLFPPPPLPDPEPTPPYL
jgi:hypothetical protein